MGTGQEKIKYQIEISPEASNRLSQLDISIRDRIVRKIDWLSENANIIAHHQLKSLPDDLKGLCRIHSGDWRILYWISHEKQKIWIFRIEHRSKVYRKL